MDKQEQRGGETLILESSLKFWKEESGQGMTEYGLILAFASIVVLVALSFLGQQINILIATATETIDDKLTLE